jgi:hypothetical protein
MWLKAELLLAVAVIRSKRTTTMAMTAIMAIMAAGDANAF